MCVVQTAVQLDVCGLWTQIYEPVKNRIVVSVLDSRVLELLIPRTLIL
jgi:hypothetical protein